MTHVDQRATAVVSTPSGPVEVIATMVGDISGDDVAMEITSRGGGADQDLSLVVVGDTAYARQALDGPWQSRPREQVAANIDALKTAVRLVDDPNQLRYIGLETVGEEQLHHLSGAGLVPYVPASGGTGEYLELDIWMQADGTPVRYSSVYRATDPTGQVVTGTSEVTFSEWGGPIEIEAPDTSASPSAGATAGPSESASPTP